MNTLTSENFEIIWPAELMQGAEQGVTETTQGTEKDVTMLDAFVNPITENPGTVALIGLGIAVLAFAGRKAVQSSNPWLRDR